MDLKSDDLRDDDTQLEPAETEELMSESTSEPPAEDTPTGFRERIGDAGDETMPTAEELPDDDMDSDDRPIL